MDKTINPFVAASSGVKTGAVAIDTGGGYLTGVLVNTDGTNPATVILYDSLGASGTKVYQGGCAGATRHLPFAPAIPIKYDTGLYLDISGTGASCLIHYASKRD